MKFACVDGPEFDRHAVNFDEAMKRQQMYKTAEGRAILKAEPECSGVAVEPFRGASLRTPDQ